MEQIERLKKYLLTVHPIRKTAYQKQQFRSWAIGELKRAGWKAREETYGRGNGSVNVVAGDPDRALVFLCAHYDTASRMFLPDFVSPTNVAAHVCYHLASALLLAAAALALSFAVSFPLHQPGLMLPLFLVLMVVLLWLAAFGPANRENANGNTSGVLTRPWPMTSGCAWCCWTTTKKTCWGPPLSGKSTPPPQAQGCSLIWTA